MSLLTELSRTVVNGQYSTFVEAAIQKGDVAQLNVSQLVFASERDLVQDLTLIGDVPSANLIRCVFAFPPGIPVLDSTSPTFSDDLLKYTRYSFPLGTPWTVVFVDVASHVESDGKTYQYQLRRTTFSNTANNFYFLGTEPVPDGYWAISGVDLIYSGTAVPGKVGPNGPGQQLFPLVNAAQAPAPWFQFFPSEQTPAIDSRRNYYLKFGVPSSTAGTAPAVHGAPYASVGLYGEANVIRKVVQTYGSSGQTYPASVGYYTYAFPGTAVPSRGFAYVPVSTAGDPRSGDFVQAPPRTYRLHTTAIPSLVSLNGTYWQYKGLLNNVDLVYEQLFEGELVDKTTDALLSVQPALNEAGFVVRETGHAIAGSFFPYANLIAFKPADGVGWDVYKKSEAVPGFE